MNPNEIYLQAASLPHQNRRAFLESVCGGDADLVQAIEERLAKADAASAAAMGDTLEGTPEEEDTVHLVKLHPKARKLSGMPGKDWQPEHIGDYEVLEELARGAMGIVYRARDSRLNRDVALKVIHSRLGQSSKSVDRFLTEAETAASLTHPNIVPIYEIGNFEGQPFFTMPLLGGGTLSERIAGLSKKHSEAVRLMVLIARGVHAAHQRGLLHRDLKPSNILMDEKGQPHVADFGLAKNLEEDDRNLTLSGQVVGTPFYMSPEQAEGRRDTLTTQSDIWSLGVLLFEMVTNRRPFEAESVVQVLREVAEAKVPHPRIHCPHLDRDLESIILKCLEKEPGQRYASAEALAEDLDRWLTGHPIQARRISTSEKAWKWMKRQPALAALWVFLVGVVLVLGVAGPAFAWQQAQLRRSSLLEARETEFARRQSEERRKQAEAARQLAEEQGKAAEVARQLAETRRLEADRQRQEADAQRALAESGRLAAEEARQQVAKELARANTITEFIKNVFGAIQPETARTLDRTLMQRVLGESAQRLQNSGLDPEVVAELQLTLGRAYQSIALYDSAAPLLAQAGQTLESMLGTKDARTLQARHESAGLERQQGHLSEALRLHETLLRDRTEFLGTNHPDTFASRNAVGRLRRQLGQLDSAAALLQPAFDQALDQLGPTHPETQGLIENLAGLYADLARHREAADLYRRIFELRRTTLGPEHAQTLAAAEQLALSHLELGEMDKAEPLLGQAHKDAVFLLGARHPQTLGLQAGLARLAQARGNWSQAETLHLRTLEARLQALGTNHPDTIDSINQLVGVMIHQDELSRADTLIHQGLQGARTGFHAMHQQILERIPELVTAYERKGYQKPAVKLLEDFVPLAEVNLGAGNPLTIRLRDLLDRLRTSLRR